MVKCLNIGKNIGKPIYQSISSFNTQTRKTDQRIDKTNILQEVQI